MRKLIYILLFALCGCTQIQIPPIASAVNAVSALVSPDSIVQIHAIPEKKNGVWRINDYAGHKPVWVAGITATNQKLRIHLSGTLEYVLSVQATVDERYAGDYVVSASFGFDWIDLNIKQKQEVYNRAEFSGTSGAGWVVGYNHGNRITPAMNGDELVIHNLVESEALPVIIPQDGSADFDYKIVRTRTDRSKVTLRFYRDGQIINDFTGIKFYYSRYAGTEFVPINPNLMPEVDFSNFWVTGFGVKK